MSLLEKARISGTILALPAGVQNGQNLSFWHLLFGLCVAVVVSGLGRRGWGILFSAWDPGKLLLSQKVGGSLDGWIVWPVKRGLLMSYSGPSAQVNYNCQDTPANVHSTMLAGIFCQLQSNSCLSQVAAKDGEIGSNKQQRGSWWWFYPRLGAWCEWFHLENTKHRRIFAA